MNNLHLPTLLPSRQKIAAAVLTFAGFAILTAILATTSQLQAKTATPAAKPSPTFSPKNLTPAEAATLSALATDSATLDSSASAEASAEAELATPSAAIIEKIQQSQDQDITNTTAKQQDKLAAYLDENSPGPLSWYNFLEYAIRHAVSNGVPASTLVLVLLFPTIASIIAASRHIIGLRGFGIYIPAVLSVALVSTGLVAGTIIFLAIITIALFSQRILKILRLSYLPRTALLL